MDTAQRPQINTISMVIFLYNGNSLELHVNKLLYEYAKERSFESINCAMLPPLYNTFEQFSKWGFYP